MIDKVSDVLQAIKEFLEKQTDIVDFVGTEFETASQSPFVLVEIPTEDNIDYLELSGTSLTHLLSMSYSVCVELHDIWESILLAMDLTASLRQRLIDKFNTDGFNALFTDFKIGKVESLKIEEPLAVVVRQYFVVQFEENIVKSAETLKELLNRLNNYKKTRIIISESIKGEK